MSHCGISEGLLPLFNAISVTSVANTGSAQLSISSSIASFLQFISFFVPDTGEIFIVDLEQQVQFKSVKFKITNSRYF